jgi:hypothetical protein
MRATKKEILQELKYRGFHVAPCVKEQRALEYAKKVFRECAEGDEKRLNDIKKYTKTGERIEKNVAGGKIYLTEMYYDSASEDYIYFLEY